VLTIRLQPDEGVTLAPNTKEPGPGGMRFLPAPLDMTFAETLGPDKLRIPDAYERLVMDVIRGDQTMFMRADEVEAAWAWIDPILPDAEDATDKTHSSDSNSTSPEDTTHPVAQRPTTLAGNTRLARFHIDPSRMDTEMFPAHTSIKQ